MPWLWPLFLSPKVILRVHYSYSKNFQIQHSSSFHLDWKNLQPVVCKFVTKMLSSYLPKVMDILTEMVYMAACLTHVLGSDQHLRKRNETTCVGKVIYIWAYEIKIQLWEQKEENWNAIWKWKILWCSMYFRPNFVPVALISLNWSTTTYVKKRTKYSPLKLLM